MHGQAEEGRLRSVWAEERTSERGAQAGPASRDDLSSTPRTPRPLAPARVRVTHSCTAAHAMISAAALLPRASRASPPQALAAQRSPHALALCAAARRPRACGARARHASLFTVAAAAEEAATDAAATESPAAPPPYSALSVPVYSLATSAPAGGSVPEACRASMNIVTYAAPLTLKPKVRSRSAQACAPYPTRGLSAARHAP
jgi:hypothetical protein